MLGHKPFYHNSLRKAVICFGRLFDQITILRVLPGEVEERRLKVPVAYGPKERFLVRTLTDPTLNRKVKMTYPRMSFEITSLTPNSENRLANTRKNRRYTGDGGISVYNPVPYVIEFELNILTKSQEDGTRILEQLLPFFNPEFTITVNVVPDVDLKDDIPVVLNSTNKNDEYTSDFMGSRSLIWTLSFTMKMNFYGPEYEEKLIKKAVTDLGIPKGEITAESIAKTARIERVTVEPDPIDALPEDDYGFTVVIEEFDDGKKFNPETGEDEPVDD